MASSEGVRCVEVDRAFRLFEMRVDSVLSFEYSINHLDVRITEVKDFRCLITGEAEFRDQYEQLDSGHFWDDLLLFCFFCGSAWWKIEVCPNYSL